MGLLPLEFTDCLQDSPYFRDSLHSHEKELERTSQNIKELIKEVKNLLSAAKNLSRAQRSLSAHLLNFKFDCIGNNQTDDELVIAGSLKEFGKLISCIEDERDRMLESAHDNFIVPLESFRKEQIGAVKARKKQFDNQTKKFCTSQERYLALSTKKPDTVLQEADAILEMEQREFAREALEYVCLIQEVQERKKFEFVETLQAFMYGWLTFYHQGFEVAKDFKPFMRDLQIRVQNTRTNFQSNRDNIEALKRKMLEVRQTKPLDPGTLNKMYTRTGYLFCMEKKALGTTWIKCYCSYIRENRLFCMIPYNQTTGKITNTESFRLKSCLRKTTESIDKRFCFELIPEDRPNITFTMQAQSEDDRLLWLEALDGREPKFSNSPGKPSSAEESYLDEAGFNFIQECVAALTNRGLEEEGLYRIVGVTSKVTKLLNSGLDRRKLATLDLDNVETKTITSAIKTFLRNLPEPLMSFQLHQKFIEAAKYDSYTSRLGEVHRLVHLLPATNRQMLGELLPHLESVANKNDKNLMTVSNLGVCFGPTLLRAEEETVAAIMDIKFANVVVEILISNWETILKTKPGFTAPPKPAHSLSSPHPSLNSPYNPSPNTYSSPHHHPPSAQLTFTSPQQTSPSSRPPPYIPPPNPSAVSPPGVVGGGGHPTLTTAVIKDGPKLHQSTPPSGGATSYATWERTLKGGNNIHHQLGVGHGLVGAAGLASSIGSVSNLMPHRSPGSSVSSLNTSGSHLTAGVTSPPHHNIQQQHHPTANTPQQPAAWYRPNQMPGRPLHQQQKHGGSTSSTNFGQSNLDIHQPVSASVKSHDHQVSPAKPLSRQLSGASGISTAVSTSSTHVSGTGGSGSTTTGHNSEYETSTTHRSSSSSTDSLASNSSRDLTNDRDNFGQLGPAARGVPGMQPVELRKVKTLYACVGEHETELSFEPNQIITSVRPSLEPGWLEGSLNGKIGLVPENYVEYVP